MSRLPRLLIRTATIGVLAAALPLMGCGRKGPLDPPPGGYALEQQQGKTPITRKGGQRPPTPKNDEGYDEQGRPIAPDGPQKRLPLDRLLD